MPTPKVVGSVVLKPRCSTCHVAVYLQHQKLVKEFYNLFIAKQSWW